MSLYDITEAIKNTLAKGESIQLIGFGTFSISERAARTGRNTKTGKKIQIAAKKVTKFKTGKALNEAVITEKKGGEGFLFSFFNQFLFIIVRFAL